MGEVEPSEGARDWSSYDPLVRDAAAARITVLPTLFKTPPWLGTKPAELPTRTAKQRAEWSRFVAEAGDRYGPNGIFWTLNPVLPYMPVRDWQLWNEPNLNGFVSGRADPRRYAQLIKITDAALGSADPGIRLGLGGLFRRPLAGTGIPMSTFLDKLYRVRGIKRHFDAVSVHPYAKSPADVLQVLERARRSMTENKDRKTQLWVTELGWTTGGGGFSKSPYKATPKGQARKLSASFHLMLKHRRELRLTRAVWHTWRDLDVAPNLWTQYMGLFTADFSPKPAWYAYARVAGGTP
jgi:hypothetical protein